MTYDVHSEVDRLARHASASSAGGRHSAGPPRPQVVEGRSRAAAWPRWSRPQLQQAAQLADEIAADRHLPLATELYRLWFNPVVGSGARVGRPLAGLYRAAHAGSASRRTRDGITTVERNDVVGRDGWWRTWNEAWLPTRSRSDGVRLLLSPRPEALGDVVRAVTRAMLATTTPWLLACSTDPARLARTAPVTLYVANSADVPAELVEQLRPMLREVTPPLTLPVVPGAGLAQAPSNGMSFGEHRCHLVALALRTVESRREPLAAIAEVFRVHGIDPAHPYRS